MKTSRSRSDVRRYPAWVFHVREDITRRNMELYDKQQAAIDTRCLELRPDYYSMPFTERFTVRKQAEKDVEGGHC